MNPVRESTTAILVAGYIWRNLIAYLEKTSWTGASIQLKMMTRLQQMRVRHRGLMMDGPWVLRAG